ncbi:MAG TPA: PHP domain-containing protein, partial [Pseudonocardiaceae bacterium]|nr:PHP domain-containing protein [Pseudonocardiaceae bacterium]
MRVDLHAHTTASDGTDTPAELMAAAAAAGLDAVAITDHDTTDGWAAAVEALPAGLRLIRGAEFSARA